jgi:TonB-dependent starch-binding outer membrane protein SusC
MIMRKLLLLLVAIVLTAGQLWAQRTVTGKVTDDKGAGIANASVMVKGTTTGTVTKADGSYSLTLPANATTLVISAVDMETQEIVVGSQTSINATLKTTAQSLSEVVVVGYGVQQKKAFTGAASKVDAKQFANLLTTSVDKQLAGRAAGVQVTNTSGIVNAPARIRIRGINSINQNNDPLIVVDGVPIISGNLAATTNSNAIGDINPDDIESIDVLKDGASLAIYGSRGAAGVILITTKKGQKGQVKLNYDGFFGFNSVLKRWDLLNADQFVTIANEKLANSGQVARAGVNPGGVNTDWQKEVFIDNATVQSHTLSFSGGSQKTTYYMSMNYSRQQGTIKSNWNKAYRIRANVESEINKVVKVGNNITLARQEDTDQNTGSNSLGGAIASTLRLLPNVSPYSTTHPSGYNIRYATSSPANSMENGPNSQGVDDNFFNIAFVLDNNQYYSDKYRIIDNLFVELTPFKNFKFRSAPSFDMLNDYSWQEWDPRHGDGYSGGGLAYNADQNFIRYSWQNYFNYNYGYKGHNFFLTAGHEVIGSRTKFLTATGTNISDVFFMKENLISGSASVQTVGGSFSKSGSEKLFARFNYDYQNRYFIQATWAREGLSSLAEDKRYGNFPGFSVGWRPSEESFWKSSSLKNIFRDVKIKGSYAKVGNPLSGLPYLTTFGAANYGNLNGIAPNSVGNKELEWETSTKYDVGLEFSLVKGRVNFMTDYFVNDIDNIVLAVPTPLSAGIPGNSIPQNIGSSKNKGIEFTIDAAPIEKKNFNWNINFNFSVIENEVTNLYSISGTPVPFIQSGSYNLIKVGESYNIIYGYKYAGVNTATGNPMYYKADGRLVMHNIPNNTFYFISDKNDGSIVPANATTMTFNDRTKLGESLPKWFGGLSNSFTYKQFGLDIMLRFSGGNKIMNTTRQEALLNQSFQNNGTEILKRWTTPGQDASVPKLYWGQGNNINQNGLAISRFVEDGDYLRLQNLVFTYTFERAKLQQWTKNALSDVKFFIQGQNLAVWTNYTGADPDNISTGGVDASVAPQIRTISVGLKVGF